jgi:hypothetical protein
MLKEPLPSYLISNQEKKRIKKRRRKAKSRRKNQMRNRMMKYWMVWVKAREGYFMCFELTSTMILQ